MGVRKNQAHGLDEETTPVVLAVDGKDVQDQDVVVADIPNGDAVAMTNPPEVVPGVEKGTPTRTERKDNKDNDEMDI